MFLHLSLLILFSIMTIFGLIFNVSEGVFVGCALIPWEMRMILAARGKVNPGLIKIILVISAVVGGIFFIGHNLWSRAFILFGVQAYIYFVVNKAQSKLAEVEERLKDENIKK